MKAVCQFIAKPIKWEWLKPLIETIDTSLLQYDQGHALMKQSSECLYQLLRFHRKAEYAWIVEFITC